MSKYEVTTALQTQPNRKVNPITDGATSIEELTRLAVSEYQEGLDGIRRSLMHFINAGSYLNEIKSLLRHGEWGLWLKVNWPTSAREAERVMRVATHQPQLEAANPTRMSEMSLSAALQQLTTPREEIVQRRADWIAKPEQAEAQITRALKANAISSEQAKELRTELKHERESVESGWRAAPEASRRLRKEMQNAEHMHRTPPADRPHHEAMKDLRAARAGIRAAYHALGRLDPEALNAKDRTIVGPVGWLRRRKLVDDLLEKAALMGARLDGLCRAQEATGTLPASPEVEVHTTISDDPSAVDFLRQAEDCIGEALLRCDIDGCRSHETRRLLSMVRDVANEYGAPPLTQEELDGPDRVPGARYILLGRALRDALRFVVEAEELAPDNEAVYLREIAGRLRGMIKRAKLGSMEAVEVGTA